MPLIKYYNSISCYDGTIEFTHPSQVSSASKRFYPDEYLIAQILQLYQNERLKKLNRKDKKIIILIEPWSGTNQPRTGAEAIDDGSENTSNINKQIMEQINLPDTAKSRLILVPFLYEYHHPGIAIDVRNKRAVYVDPFGTSAEVLGLSKVIELTNELKDLGFSVETVTTKQETDGVSCGPILTASMMKFTEEFLKNGTITSTGFQKERSDLASIRIFQMYVNNTIKLDDSNGYFVNELMLASTQLWEEFSKEQALANTVIQSIISTVKKQRTFIVSLTNNWVSDELSLKKVQFIRDFQSKLIELIFLKDPSLEPKLKELNALSEHSLSAQDVTELSRLISRCSPENTLLDNRNIAKIQTTPLEEINAERMAELKRNFKKEFFSLHDTLYAQSKGKHLFGIFKKAHVKRSMDFDAIVEHALSRNNLSRDVFKRLKWLSEDNEIIHSGIKAIYAISGSAGNYSAPHTF